MEMKTKFISNIWITGFYNEKEVIGRTCFVNDKKSVVIIDEDARTLVIDYYEITNICKINFVDKTRKQTPNIGMKLPSPIQSLKLMVMRKEMQN